MLVTESIGLDSVNALGLDSKSALDSVDSFGLRFCRYALFRISLDSVLVFESVLGSVELDSESNSKTLNLDSESVLGSTPLGLCFCSLFRISLDSVITLESVGLDSVDSKFLRIAFSRIFSNFLESRVCAKRKGVLSPPRTLKAPKKSPLFLLRFACNPLGLFGNRGECLAFSLSSQKC